MKTSLRTYEVELVGKKGSADREERGSLKDVGNYWCITEVVCA